MTTCYVLLFAADQWQWLVPTSWEVIPNGPAWSGVPVFVPAMMRDEKGRMLKTEIAP